MADTQIILDAIKEQNKILFQQNGDLAVLKEKVSNIESQTTKTNGRVLKLEADVVILQGKNNQDFTVRKMNWKWVSALGAIALSVFSFLINLFVEWLKHKFF